MRKAKSGAKITATSIQAGSNADICANSYDTQKRDLSADPIESRM